MTRGRMIQAAHQLFLEVGYQATTMQAVADASGVAVQTVYYTFRTKQGLLAEVEAHAVLGDRPASEWGQAPWVHRLSAAKDRDVLVRAFVSIDTDIKSRIAPLVAAVGSALAADPDSVRQRERGQDEFFAFFVSRLAALDGLRADVTPAHAVDILHVINSLPNFVELTIRRSWSRPQWRRWLTDTISTQLLPTDT